MARKRSFLQKVLSDDQFRSLPLKTRWLYVLLNFEADNDGFIKSADYTVQNNGCSSEDIEALIEIGYLMRFENGLLLVRHWGQHNSVRPSRRSTTPFKEELAQVGLDSSGIYQLKTSLPDQSQDVCQKGRQNGRQKKPAADQKKADSPAKHSAGKKFVPPTLDEVRSFIQANGYSVDPETWYNYYCANGWKAGRNNMKSWESSVRYWESKNKNNGGKYDSKRTDRKAQQWDTSDSSINYYD